MPLQNPSVLLFTRRVPFRTVRPLQLSTRLSLERPPCQVQGILRPPVVFIESGAIRVPRVGASGEHGQRPPTRPEGLITQEQGGDYQLSRVAACRTLNFKQCRGRYGVSIDRESDVQVPENVLDQAGRASVVTGALRCLQWRLDNGTSMMVPCRRITPHHAAEGLVTPAIETVPTHSLCGG